MSASGLHRAAYGTEIVLNGDGIPIPYACCRGKRPVDPEQRPRRREGLVVNNMSEVFHEIDMDPHDQDNGNRVSTSPLGRGHRLELDPA